MKKYVLVTWPDIHKAKDGGLGRIWVEKVLGLMNF